MKKIFTLAAAVLASFSLWAAEPDFESFNWGADDFATVFADHDGVVISSDASTWKGNFSGVQYVALGGGTDMSAENPTPFFGVTAAAGIDSVEIYWCPNGTDASNLAWIAWDDAANFKKQQVDYKGEGPEYTGSKSIEGATWQMFDFSATDEKAILFGRQLKKVTYEGSQYQLGKNKTVNILGVRVWLHETKTIVSTVETLTAVTINDNPLAAADFTKLVTEHTLMLEDSAYVTAPVVKFTKHTVITYDDQTTKEKDEVIEKTSQQAQASMWGAMVDIAGVAYSVYTIKPLSYTVTYKLDDESVLGTEVVAAGTSPKEYKKYEVMPLSTFKGWYDSDYLERVDLSQVVVNSDMSFYADFDKAYAQSINIEQWILDNGKNNTAFKALLQERGYAYENINELDSLNDDPSKANRNEPYLGLKIKKTGGNIAFNVLPGQSVAIKFGNVDAAVKISVFGVDTTLTPEEKALPDLTFKAEAETMVKIATTTDKTVVIKQIMIDEPIADVVLPGKTQYVATCDSTVNGTILINGENSWTGYPGDTVVVTYQPAIGYQLDTMKVDGKVITPEEGLYYFIMPAKNVRVSATFKEADPIVPPTRYAITIAEMQNGTVTADKEYASATELVTLTVTPAEGYKVVDVKVNDKSLNPSNGTYSFEMPAEDVTISATFELENQGIEDAYMSVKAVKVVRDGQVLIIRDGKMYNALGAEVK